MAWRNSGMPAAGVYFVKPSASALAAASLMCCGVSKSGSPAPNPTTSSPAAFMAFALESIASVSEGASDAARQVMVRSGQVEKAELVGLVRPAGHARGKIAHVNAVLAHVEKDENLGRAGNGQIGLFHVNFEIAPDGAEVVIPVAVSAAPA